MELVAGETLAERIKQAAYVPSTEGLSSGKSQGHLLFLREGTLMTQTWDVNHSALLGEAVPVVEQVSSFSSSVLGDFSASANGTLVYRTGEAPNLQPTWFGADGKVLGPVGEPGRYLVLALSPDGTKAALEREEPAGNANLWVLDLSQGTSTRLTAGQSRDGQPVFSPDGSQVVFLSARGDASGLYRKASSGVGTEDLLLKSPVAMSLTDWSRDGRFVIYHVPTAQTAQDFKIWVVPMDGDHKPFPFLRTQFREFGARLSPDGHGIAYTSNESGKNEIYVRRFIPEPDGEATAAAGNWIVSRGGGSGMVHWRRDGKELYYLSPDAKVMTVEVSTTPDFHASAPKPLFAVPEALLRLSATPRHSG